MTMAQQGSLWCSVCAYLPQADEPRCKLCGRQAQRCDMCGRDCRNPVETFAAVFCRDCAKETTEGDV